MYISYGYIVSVGGVRWSQKHIVRNPPLFTKPMIPAWAHSLAYSILIHVDTLYEILSLCLTEPVEAAVLFFSSS